jgi:hypothetical protein
MPVHRRAASTATTPTNQQGDQLWIEPWIDDRATARHEAHSPYVERYWLSVLGPTASWLLRIMASELERSPEGVTLDLAETSAALGLGYRSGRNAPISRSIERLVLFDIACHRGFILAVRRHLPDLSTTQLRRLPAPLRRAHIGVEAEHIDPVAPGHKARRLALVLAELGETPATIEAQLRGWNVEPSTAQHSVQWAMARLARHPSALTPSEPSGGLTTT